VTTAFIVFFGRGGGSEIERRLDSIKIAIGASVLARAGEAGFEPLLAVTADPAARAAFAGGGADVVAPRTEPFHFGQELLALSRARGLERIATIGAGAGALMSTAELSRLRDEIDAGEALVLSNNYYSADLVAFTPASALTVIDLPATDNPLPRRLHQQGGLSSRQLDRSAATLLDVDTPADAAVLKRHPACPPELRGLDAWDDELGQRIDALMRLITTPERELIVAGRAGAPVWSYLESQTACRVRVLAEERGMQAAGRDTSGEARTALGFLYREIGPAPFFTRLGELGDGMLFDTRVLFAHLGWQPSAQDRFASDLFRAESLAHAELRAFTAAARAARFPLLLGGHTLVSGVLWTLVEAAWSSHPEP
jgi:CTP:molybdopterin cytidylyltransferase MocA